MTDDTTSGDGYYGDTTVGDGEFDLSFLDDDTDRAK
jgi:hypothetical protein